MAGHNKWSKVKRKKAVLDAKRSKIFTKIIREITVAARETGGDPELNPRLRLAIDHANAANMPKENIENAIKKGTGELEGVDYEEYTYEGYGPAGTAFFIEAMTDNKNRTVSEVRHLFDKHGGNLGADGCVAWQFDHRGMVIVDASTVKDNEHFQLHMIELGAQEFGQGEDDDGNAVWEVHTTYDDFAQTDERIRQTDYKVLESSLTRIPTSVVKIETVKEAEQVMNFFDLLDDHDDVQNVYANFEIDESILGELD
jgi:YebC/PmpR family DNA-binding regulatory protein